MATGIGLSRVSGLARERVVGYYFGTGVAADAYSAAARIPNLLQNLLGEGVLSASMIPPYSRLVHGGRHREAAQLAGAIAGLVLAAVVTSVGVIVLAARPITQVLTPGFDPDTLDLTVRLVRIITPAIGALVLSAWCLAILNSHRRFFLPYASPVVMNLAQIAVLVVAAVVVVGGFRSAVGSEDTITLVEWLAWGTVIGGVLQFAVQIPAVLRCTPGLRLSLRGDAPEVRATVRTFFPVVAGRGVVYIGGYVQLLMASFLALGAMAALRYSQMLYMVPVSLFGMSVAAAQLPDMSTSVLTPAALQQQVRAGLARIAFFVIPTAAAFVLVGDVLVAALFQTGEFDRRDALQVWLVLALHAVGLLAATWSRLLQSALYALDVAKTPARVALVRVVVSVALGVVLMFQFDRVVLTADGLERVGGLPAFSPLPAEFRDGAVANGRNHLGVAGLALAAAVASFVEYWLLRRALTRRIGPTHVGRGHLWPMVAASAASIAAATVVRLVVDGAGPIVTGITVIAAAAITYLAAATALKIPEARRLAALLRRPH